MLRWEHAGIGEILPLDRPELRYQPHDRSVRRMVPSRAGRAVDRVQLTLQQHVRQRPARRRHRYPRRIGFVAFGVRCVDVADGPLHVLRRNAHVVQEMAVPDRAARRPAVHADALAREPGHGADGRSLPHIQIARREVAQHEHRQPHGRSVTTADTPQMQPHRGLAALHRVVAKAAPQHVGTIRPRPLAAQDQIEPDPLHPDRTRSERHHPGVIGTGQPDLLRRHITSPSVVRHAASGRSSVSISCNRGRRAGLRRRCPSTRQSAWIGRYSSRASSISRQKPS